MLNELSPWKQVLIMGRNFLIGVTLVAITWAIVVLVAYGVICKLTH